MIVSMNRTAALPSFLLATHKLKKTHTKKPERRVVLVSDENAQWSSANPPVRNRIPNNPRERGGGIATSVLYLARRANI